jgi:probable DNA metabolism protein
MLFFTYDSSFEGFLSAVFDVYDRKASLVRIVCQEQYQPNMFGEQVVVYADTEKAFRVWKGLSKRLSSEALKNIYHVFLSELPEREEVLLSFMRQVFASRDKVEENFADPAVLKVAQIGRQLFREKHRFEAFVRFQKLQDGTYYASIDPDFNVLPLIVPHFTERYADQPWIIYDTRRKYGVHYDLKEVREVSFTFEFEHSPAEDSADPYDEQEDLYQLLWQSYFKNVNILARKNLKLHRRHVPLRYWKYLTEKKPF